MLSESSRNQKSMWTKLPAALRWISAVHHCTLCDTYHQLNTKHDKELLRNNLLFNSVQYSEVLQWKTTENRATRSHVQLKNSCHCFGKFIRQCMKNTMDDENVRNMEVNRVQLLFHNWTCNGQPQSCRWQGSQDLSNRATALLGCNKTFFWRGNSQCCTSQIWTVWESGQMAEDRSLQKGTERF